MKTGIMNPVLIDKKAICELIPHSGSMCLLESVESWDKSGIRCVASDIHHPGHPLRFRGKFTAIAALELGAQAMAVHGGLLASDGNETISQGYLAALRRVTLNVVTLDHTTKPILIDALRLMGDRTAQIYQFTVSSANHTLVSAKATVMSIPITDK